MQIKSVLLTLVGIKVSDENNTHDSWCHNPPNHHSWDNMKSIKSKNKHLLQYFYYFKFCFPVSVFSPSLKQNPRKISVIYKCTKGKMKKKKTELKPLPCFRGFLAHTRGKGPASSPCKKLVAGTSPLLATFAKKSASSRQPKKVGPCDLNCPTNLDWFQCKSLLSQPVWTGGCSGKSQIRQTSP